MSRKWIIIIICFLPIIFTQCSDPVSSGPVSDLFSLKPGNKWQYITYEYFYGKERIYDTLTVEIKKEIAFNLNGKTYNTYVQQKSDGQFLEDWNWLYSNGENGIYQCGGISSGDTLFRRDLRYKYPVNKGDSWNVPFLEYDYDSQKFIITETLKYECYSTNDSLTTPAGTFHYTVYHYKRHPSEDVMEYWEYFEYIAPNVGRVGTIIRHADSGDLVFKTLINSYGIK